MSTPPLFFLDGVPLVDVVLLTGDEGRHAGQVLRVRPGEPVWLSDGRGALLECTVRDTRPDGVVLRVDVRREVPRPDPQLIVVQALPKGDRGELAVEVMTEAGVDAVVPWAASRCVTQWRGERGAKSLAKWRSTAREAAKQARRLRFPDVAEPVTTRQLLPLLAAADFAAVLHEEGAAPLATAPLPAAGSIVLVVGPEGGVAPEELAAFAEAGAAAYRLGPTVLRTSTAGVAAVSVLLARTGRWG